MTVLHHVPCGCLKWLKLGPKSEYMAIYSMNVFLWHIWLYMPWILPKYARKSSIHIQITNCLQKSRSTIDLYYSVCSLVEAAYWYWTRQINVSLNPNTMPQLSSDTRIKPLDLDYFSISCSVPSFIDNERDLELDQFGNSLPIETSLLLRPCLIQH